jgi:hypothetical protein
LPVKNVAKKKESTADRLLANGVPPYMTVASRLRALITGFGRKFEEADARTLIVYMAQVEDLDRTLDTIAAGCGMLRVTYTTSHPTNQMIYVHIGEAT